MKQVNLNALTLPEDLKNLSQHQLESLAEQIREKLVSVSHDCGGHLASNLGVVELTLALHAVLDSPKDKIIWDVSHQAYVHKMLTGRLDKIYSLRKYQGLSGFCRIVESPHDAFGAGHASTSISAALGIAHARDIKEENFSVVSVIGDGSLSGGMAFEALNNVDKLKSNFIVIVNDNDMAISRPIGSMAKYMTQLRTSRTYNSVKHKIERIVERIPRIGSPLKRRIERMVERVRDIVLDFKLGVIFEEFGFRYLGPLDGHNIPILMAAIRYAKNYNGPIMIHVITKKGKGHSPAEEDPIAFHGISPQKNKSTDKTKTFTQIFGENMLTLAKTKKDLVVITPAMAEGSGLTEFAKEFPARFFDVGIAEEHAVTFAAGLAKEGLKPVVSIYSTFLQRGYDQVVHDVCLQNLPVVFAIDRAGLVGEDGPTHHGVYDIPFLLHIPNLTIISPKDGRELKASLHWALDAESPVAIRYPRGKVPSQDGQIFKNFADKSAEIMLNLPEKNDKAIEVLLIGTGANSWSLRDVGKDLFAKTKKSVTVLNLRFLKPLDMKIIEKYISCSKNIFIVEESSSIGGIFAYIMQSLTQNKDLKAFYQIALPDKFIEAGAIEILQDKYHFSRDALYKEIINKL